MVTGSTINGRLKRLHKYLTAVDPELGGSTVLNGLLVPETTEDELKGLDVEDEEMVDGSETRLAEMERRLMILEQTVGTSEHPQGCG